MARSVADLAPKPKNDAYTVLLTISLAAMIGACLMLWNDIQQYPSLKPTDVAPVQMPAKSAAPTAPPTEPARVDPTKPPMPATPDAGKPAPPVPPAKPPEPAKKP